jgi:large subunit ribosomal protein L25
MKLKAKKRDLLGKKVKRLRAQGMVPAAVFGPGFASVSVAVDEKEFMDIFKKVEYNRFFDLEVEGQSSPLKVLVKEIQRDFLKDNILSISFYKIDENRKISVEVPVKLVGESPAIKLNLGFLVQNANTILVHCYPKDVPNEFVVDISPLAKTGDSITVGMLDLPKNVELDSSLDPSSSIAYIAARQKAVVTESTEAEGSVESESESEGGDESGSDETS